MSDSKPVAGWLPSHDARWMIATILTVAGLLWMKVDGLENRMDDINASLNARIDDLRADVNARMDELAAQVAELRNDLRRIDDRLRAVELALGSRAPEPDR